MEVACRCSATAGVESASWTWDVVVDVAGFLGMGGLLWRLPREGDGLAGELSVSRGEGGEAGGPFRGSWSPNVNPANGVAWKWAGTDDVAFVPVLGELWAGSVTEVENEEDEAEEVDGATWGLGVGVATGAEIPAGLFAVNGK